MARRVEIEFVSDRLAGARLAQAYAIAVPERRRVTANERSDDERDLEATGRVAAIYARVSSERQREEGTIASQLAGLRELAAERGLIVSEELVFCDEGFSGATLDPAGARAAARPRRRGGVRGAAVPRAGSARAPLRLPGAAARGARSRRRGGRLRARRRALGLAGGRAVAPVPGDDRRVRARADPRAHPAREAAPRPHGLTGGDGGRPLRLPVRQARPSTPRATGRSTRPRREVVREVFRRYTERAAARSPSSPDG